MDDVIKISAVIITYNEEDNIRKCLFSLEEVVDEIVVVDSFSEDKTQEICDSFGTRFIQHPFDGHIEQKNFAMSQASHDWVLSLDADEALSAELASSILSFRDTISLSSTDAYCFNRLTQYCGRWIRHSGWYPDRKIRLWHRSVGKWGGVNPHDKVVLEEGKTVQHLKGDLLHYSYSSINQHERQTDYFAKISAEEDFKSGKRIPFVLGLIKPIVKFLGGYIFRLGFLDGYYGYQLCKISARGKYLKYKYLKEMYAVPS